jgi:uncharacterized membrane protein YvbJ
MRNCPYCDKQIEQDAFFCPHCGRETALESTPQPAPPPELPPESNSIEAESMPTTIGNPHDRKKTFLIIGLVAIPIILCAFSSFCGIAATILAVIGETTGGADF